MSHPLRRKSDEGVQRRTPRWWVLQLWVDTDEDESDTQHVRDISIISAETMDLAFAKGTQDYPSAQDFAIDDPLTPFHSSCTYSFVVKELDASFIVDAVLELLEYGAIENKERDALRDFIQSKFS